MTMADPNEFDFDQFLTGLQDSGFDYPAEAAIPPAFEEPDEEPPVEPDEPDPGPGPAAPPPPPDTLRIGERDVPLSEVQAFYELGKMFREGEVVKPLTQQGGPGVEPPVPPTAPPAPPSIPDFIDQDDPTQMGVWNAVQSAQKETNEQLAAVRSQVEQFQSQQNFNQMVENGRIALGNFRTKYPSIDDAEIHTILSLAQPIADSLVARYQNPVEALEKAFYISALDFDTTRAKIFDTQTPQQKSQDRKKKLGSLSGSSGTSQRSQQPRPQLSTDKQAVGEFASALAESYGANGRLS